jgi:hypothetical protein
MELFPNERSGSGSAAQEGTCAHALVEACLAKAMMPEDFRGRIIEILRPDTDEEGTSILKPNAKAPTQPGRVWFEVDDDMIAATTVMVEYVLGRMRAMGLGDDPVSAIDAGTLALEKRTNPLPGREDTGGTADVTLSDGFSELEIVDYKHGKGVFVPVTRNEQLRSYLLGRVLDVFGEVDASTVYRYAIVQPRNPDAISQSDAGDGVMCEEVTGEELLRFREWLEEAARRVDLARQEANEHMTDGVSTGEGPDALLSALYHRGFVDAGDGSHCTFCDLKAVCPAQRAMVQEATQVDFDDDPDVDSLRHVEDEDLARYMAWVPAIDKWCRAIKQRAKERLFAGQPLPGYKVVRNNGKRVFRHTVTIDGNEVELTDAMLRVILDTEFGLDPEAAFTDPTPQRLTGPAIEKQIKGKGSGDLKKRFSAMLLEYVPGSLTIAPEDDRRPAVEVTPGDDFDDDLDEEEDV